MYDLFSTKIASAKVSTSKGGGAGVTKIGMGATK